MFYLQKRKFRMNKKDKENLEFKREILIEIYEYLSEISSEDFN